MTTEQFSQIGFGNTALYKKYKLKVFFEDFVERIKQGFGIYQDVYYSDVGLNVEEVGSVHGLLEQARVLPTSSAISVIKSTLKMRLSQTQQANQFLSRYQQSRDLQDERFWQRLNIDNLTELQKIELAEFKEEYLLHGKFAHYSANSLLSAYDVLNRLEQDLLSAKQQASAAAKRGLRRLPAEINQSCQQYVDERLAFIQQERVVLVNAMLARLQQAAADPALEHDDVLSPAVGYLKKLGLVNKATSKSHAITKASHKLTPESFTRFHQIIEQHGSDHLKRKLSQLPWFYLPYKDSANSLSPHRNLSNGANDFAQYFMVANIVPAKTRKPAWLFKGLNLRHHWFDNFHAQAKVIIGFKHVQQESAKPIDSFALNQLAQQLQLLSDNTQDNASRGGDCEV